MRMRKKKHAAERIQACAGYMNIDDMLENEKAIYLEIGCGKGDFICGMAQKYPDINFVAAEYSPDVIVMAMEKAKNLNLTNVKFIITDAKNLDKYFPENKIAAIYLNFSDPWRKRYQWHFRLTHTSFLQVYKKILKPGAVILLKTDNKDFFSFSVKSLTSNGFIIKNHTCDLYNSELLNGNIQTEYEKKFVGQNIHINYLTAVLADDIDLNNK